MPADFLVLSGDDALTLPLMAIGGRGVISVASNEVPAEMVQMVEAAERGDFAAARRWHDKLLPLMQVNFVESNPVPVKFAMAAMGLLRGGRTGCRWCRRVRRRKDKMLGGAEGSRPAGRGRGARVNLADTHRPSLFAPGHRTRTRPRRARRSSSCAALLGTGAVRAAEPDAASPSGWRVNAWVKQGILLGFRFGDTVDMSADHGRWPFFDKDTLPLKKPGVDAGVRIVPGGSTIREGAFVDRSVDLHAADVHQHRRVRRRGTLVDSHALVGSCAQIGKRVHLSAAAQIGGVLEPVGALPVIIEDDVLVGGNSGVYEGAMVKQRAVLAAGVVLTGSTPLYDLPNGRDHRAEPRPAADRARRRGRRAGLASGDGGRGPEWGLSLATPVIVKYRDERTDARTELEAWIR